MNNEIEKLVEDLEEDKKLITGPRCSNISKAINFLRTLHPQYDVELVGILEERIELAVRGSAFVHLKIGTARQIAFALSRPQKFDVLEHLREGGKIHRPTWGKGSFIHIDSGHDEIIYSDGCRASHSELAMGTDWQPYTEPELEDGFAWFKKPEQNNVLAIYEVRYGIIYHANGSAEISDPHHWEFVSKIETPEDT